MSGGFGRGFFPNRGGGFGGYPYSNGGGFGNSSTVPNTVGGDFGGDQRVCGHCNEKGHHSHDCPNAPNDSSASAGGSAVYGGSFSGSNGSVDAVVSNQDGNQNQHQSAVDLERLKIVECPICLECMLPPYLQCLNGHVVCNGCLTKIAECPTCRGAKPAVRNLALEKMANTMLFPCKFLSVGCVQSFVPTNKFVHESKECGFRPYKCPIPDICCDWQGELAAILAHLQDDHGIATMEDDGNISAIPVFFSNIDQPSKFDWVSPLSVSSSSLGGHFLLLLEKRPPLFRVIVRLIDGADRAKQFKYRLVLSKDDCEVSWTAKPRGIRDGDGNSQSNADEHADCLTISDAQAQFFAETDGDLTIWFSVRNA